MVVSFPKETILSVMATTLFICRQCKTLQAPWEKVNGESLCLDCFEYNLEHPPLSRFQRFCQSLKVIFFL